MPALASIETDRTYLETSGQEPAVDDVRFRRGRWRLTDRGLDVFVADVTKALAVYLDFMKTQE